jgi:hypothetical protein
MGPRLVAARGGNLPDHPLKVEAGPGLPSSRSPPCARYGAPERYVAAQALIGLCRVRGLDRAADDVETWLRGRERPLAPA